MANDKPRLAPVKMLYAYWPSDDERIEAGEIVELPLEQAKALILSGKAERADPMPGEE